MQTYNDFKTRAATVFPYDSEMEQTQTKSILVFGFQDHLTITGSNVENFFKAILNCPEIFANEPKLRTQFSPQIIRILESHVAPYVTEDTRLAITDFMGWLKTRSDYVMTDEEKAKAMPKAAAVAASSAEAAAAPAQAAKRSLQEDPAGMGGAEASKKARR